MPLALVLCLINEQPAGTWSACWRHGLTKDRRDLVAAVDSALGADFDILTGCRRRGARLNKLCHSFTSFLKRVFGACAPRLVDDGGSMPQDNVFGN